MIDYAGRLRELAELAALILVPFAIAGATMLIERLAKKKGMWR